MIEHFFTAPFLANAVVLYNSRGREPSPRL